MHLRSGIHCVVCVRRETEKKNREQKSGRHQPDAGLPAVAEMIKTENEIENTPAGKRPGYFMRRVYYAARYFFAAGGFLFRRLEDQRMPVYGRVDYFFGRLFRPDHPESWILRETGYES